MARLHIFRQGCHVAMSGEAACFSASDLAECARAYDPHRYPAPLVLGHPDSNGPAYGHVVKLGASEGDLFAEVEPSPALRGLVQAGRFKFLSASFWRPHSPGNPAPGSLSLRHVGFLGAHPPAVKGLAPVAFAESLIDFSGCDPIETAARIMAGLDAPALSFADDETDTAARRMLGQRIGG